MPEFFSSDGSLPLQFLVIFGVIVVLMMAAYFLFRRIFGRGIALQPRSGNRGRQPRLGIVDIYELDRQRQLILLRRDNVEHLLLVGGPNDVVIERNVQRGAGSRLSSETVMRPDPASDMPVLPDEDDAFAPGSFEMPVVVATPLPGTPDPAELAVPRLDPALFEPDLEPQETVPVDRGEASTARAGRASPFLRRTPPPLVEPRREPASERLPVAAEMPILTPPEPRPVDPTVLSDMAQQLQTAIKRSSSAVTPPPQRPGGPPPARSDAAPARVEPAPVEPAPARIEPAAEPAPVSPARAGPDPIAARMAASPTPAPATPAAPAPTPEPDELPAAPIAAPVPEPVRTERKPEPAKGTNPFSVEEIEAEFARLLGRPLDKKE